MKKLPNILTITRFILAIIFIFFLLRSGLSSLLFAALLFTLACLTDYFDGYYAKKHNFISTFGKIMDPIADKFLILAAFFVFMRMNIIAAWMFYVILTREFVVTGSRFLALKRGAVLAAEQAGKYKTILQIVTISVILLFMVFEKIGWIPYWSYDFWGFSIYSLMCTTVLLTLFSGFSYFWNNRHVFYY